MKTGIYPLSEDLYLADPCDTPSLSASIAKIIWQDSPLHAWIAHPKLNPNYEPENKRQFDIGSAAHAILLENSESKLILIEADNYRTKAAQEERDAAYDAGLIPLFQKDLDAVRQMVKIAKQFVSETELIGVFNDGKPEQTLIYDDGVTAIRSRLDWLTNDRQLILDYKTTGGSSKPEQWIRRQLFPLSMDIQAYVYLYLNEKTGGSPNAKFVFLVQEDKEPYACSLVGAGPSVIESGKKKFRYALHKWKYCMENNIWPSYDKRIHWADVPSWEMAKVEAINEYNEN